MYFCASLTDISSVQLNIETKNEHIEYQNFVSEANIEMNEKKTEDKQYCGIWTDTISSMYGIDSPIYLFRDGQNVLEILKNEKILKDSDCNGMDFCCTRNFIGSIVSYSVFQAERHRLNSTLSGQTIESLIPLWCTW